LNRLDKKGVETESLKFVISLVITAFIVVALISIIYIILPASEKEEQTLNQFSYVKLVEGIKTLGFNENKNLSYAPAREKVLVGFSNTLSSIAKISTDDKCTNVDFINEIKKPMSCQGNACLCLCDADVGSAGIGNLLIFNCETEETKCEILENDVSGDESCNYFVYYNAYGETKDLSLNKVQNKIIIKAK